MTAKPSWASSRAPSTTPRSLVGLWPPTECCWWARRRWIIDDDWIMAGPWIMREQGSGTRSTFEEAIRARSLEPEQLNIVLTLPSNEAVLAAVRAGVGYAVLSHLVVAPAIEARAL